MLTIGALNELFHRGNSVEAAHHKVTLQFIHSSPAHARLLACGYNWH